MRRSKNISGIISGGPSLDLVLAVERFVYRKSIDENERVEFENIDLQRIAIESANLSENTALHKVLDELAYLYFYIYMYDDLDWVGDYYEFANYAIEMFGHMKIRVPKEFYRKTEDGILEARKKHRNYFLSGLKHLVESAFSQLWLRKSFLFDFNMRLAEEISPLLKSEYPVLAKNGQLPRVTYFPVWIKDLIMYRERGLCHYCGCIVAHPSVPNQNYDVDHMVPIAKGETNDPTNLALSCPKCNNKKRAKALVVPDTFAWPVRN
ncbi:HNH endonuclease signature motif containing protein [Pseudomonas orientalis]|uniref:HNH endonuclease n=1 Tax=Pseudomonas orientalis TaxID=76758 RepID=UPI0030D76E38